MNRLVNIESNDREHFNWCIGKRSYSNSLNPKRIAQSDQKLEERHISKSEQKLELSAQHGFELKRLENIMIYAK